MTKKKMQDCGDGTSGTSGKTIDVDDPIEPEVYSVGVEAIPVNQEAIAEAMPFLNHTARNRLKKLAQKHGINVDDVV